jgi:hypothetical protein
MSQEFHKDGGDINARDRYATPQPDVPILAPAESAPSTARERYLAENKCFGATALTIRLIPFFGGYPHPGYPAPFCVFCFLPLMPPHLCRVPLVHAAAAWHRSGWTPLMHAADNGHIDAVALLVRMGADLDAQATYFG